MNQLQPCSTLFPYTTLFRSSVSPKSSPVLAIVTIVFAAAIFVMDTFTPFDMAIAVLYVVVVLMARSEEHTSELQSPCNLVCRLLLEKKQEDRIRISSG